MSSVVKAVSAVAGLADDQVRLVLCIILSIPLGFIHKRLPSANIKHIYSLAFGILFTYWCYGWPFLHLLFTSLAAYVAVLVMKEKAALPVFIGSMTYLTASHVYRVWTDYMGWTLDYTTSQMCFTVKMVTFAYTVADGIKMKMGKPIRTPPAKREGDKEKEKEKEKEKGKEEDRLEVFMRPRVVEMPNLLQYLSYMFCYLGVLSGPCFEIREYLEFTDLTMFKKVGLDRIPSTVAPCLERSGRTLISLVITILTMRFLPVLGYMDKEAFLVGTTILYRMLYIMASVPLNRFRYYFAWYLSETACVASGIGFNGRDPAHPESFLWDRANTAEVVPVEFGTSVPEITNNWNKGVNVWLKYYVYYRLEYKVAFPWLKKFGVGPKLVANVFTKCTSALWHGVYAGYYVFFVSSVFVQLAHEAATSVLLPWVKKYPRFETAFYIYSHLAVHPLGLSLIGPSFYVLSLSATLNVFRSIYFLSYWIPLVRFLFWKFLMARLLRVPREKTQTPADNKTGTAVATTLKDKQL
eukprot:TRINITY_DN280_c0_g1_i1.p1 TRINITY_DN280_c0_g1~~TRINITY_DN280_c0_g1_i1.p1  ORF type:complete len:523 (-),score=79.14 TRINITY_DN280_c0_g1_i1:99-1667(-)